MFEIFRAAGPEPVGFLLVPKFSASIPAGHAPYPGGTVTVATTQIQYSQKVLLNFHGLSWPHASVANLVPADPIVINL